MRNRRFSPDHRRRRCRCVSLTRHDDRSRTLSRTHIHTHTCAKITYGLRDYSHAQPAQCIYTQSVFISRSLLARAHAFSSLPASYPLSRKHGLERVVRTSIVSASLGVRSVPFLCRFLPGQSSEPKADTHNLTRYRRRRVGRAVFREKSATGNAVASRRVANWSAAFFAN